ncbi:MAG: Xaa-Pro peptidase family protein [Paracoccaceae bacterium]|nr:Xaa-Pro peptidase family protein [Paracoccaceae bacterium]
MNQDIVNKVITTLKEKNLDAFVVASPENFAYLAGFVVPSHHVLRWRHSMLILTADARVFAFTVDMEESTVRRNLPDISLRCWREFADNPMQLLADYLLEIGLKNASIGIELDYLPAGDFKRLEHYLPNVSFTCSASNFNQMRCLKTPAEIALLRQLSRIADQSIYEAYQSVAPGSTEMDIAGALTRKIYEQGAQDFKFMIVATGDRSQLPNVGPSLRKLESGDICRVEIFPIINGYHAGVCRTASVGKPTSKASEIWSVLSNATKELLELIKPGVAVNEIYKSYLKMVEPLNMPPIDFVGHGIGLHLHEDPYLAQDDQTLIQEGMVFGIEPLIYKTGYGFGMQNKDMILVTKEGSELLSDYTDTTSLINIS